MRCLRGLHNLLVVTVMVSFGCASGSLTMSSRRGQVGGAPIERLLVLANLKSQGFSESMYEGFSTALAGQMRACHVEPKIFHTEPDNDRWATAVEGEAASFAPSATLIIRATGGVLQKNSGVVQAARIVVAMRIEATGSGAELWRAKLAFDVNTGSVWYSDTASGERLASLLSARLRDDGVLDHCPPATGKADS